MRTKEELERLKATGNEYFRRKDYHGALEQYNCALGGPNGRGDGLQLGLLLPLLNNRAACYLEIADAMRGPSTERIDAYRRAECDADDCSKTSNIMGGSAKALFRLGRATLGKQMVTSQLVDKSLEQHRLGAEEALAMRKDIARALEVGCMHLHTALKMAPGDAMITDKIHEAERLQQALAIKGAPPMLQVGVPVPRPDTFGPSVLFTKGDSWMSNTVALEIPVSIRHQATRHVMLPIFLTKQENDRNRGELAIWMHYSEHLGKSELKSRGVAAFGPDAEYDVFVGNAYGNLSTPAQANDHIRSPDEFIMDFHFARHGQSPDEGIPGALVAAGVIERVRVAGQTQFGENFVVYRVKF
jgi:hypothetical protein